MIPWFKTEVEGKNYQRERNILKCFSFYLITTGLEEGKKEGKKGGVKAARLRDWSDVWN